MTDLGKILARLDRIIELLEHNLAPPPPPPESDPCHPVEDWRYAVVNGDTVLGYRQWLEHRHEEDRHDKPETGVSIEIEDDGEPTI